MITIEKVDVVGWESAIRGMRNPLNSWDKSDSEYRTITNADGEEETYYRIGFKDLGLMHKLRLAGTADHRKFMRMITVYADITAPLYYFKEFDTYKVGTVANSCSTMHTIHTKEFTLDDFSHEHLGEWSEEREYVYYNDEYVNTPTEVLEFTIDALNHYRELYLATKDKKYWWWMIQLLPSSYNQKRTVMLNYEVLANMYHSRKNHKLNEWREFCKWIENLPHSELITGDI